MKSITIAGNIGRDAVTRTTQGGEAVTGWTVAVEERKGQEKRTLWFDCNLWGKRGESLAQYLTKGSKVAVTGDLSTREHEGKTYLTVRVSEVTLLGGGQRDDAPRTDAKAAAYAAQAPYGAPAGGFGAGRDMDDEIPFAPEWRA